jgi:hypothetical protein
MKAVQSNPKGGFTHQYRALIKIKRQNLNMVVLLNTFVSGI